MNSADSDRERRLVFGRTSIIVECLLLFITFPIFFSYFCRLGAQCYKCKEWGHIKRDCPTCDKKDSQGLESSMTVAENTVDPRDILIIFKEDTYSQDDCVLNLGATNHICSRRKFFETFQESKEGLSLCLTGPSVTSWGWER